MSNRERFTSLQHKMQAGVMYDQKTSPTLGPLLEASHPEVARHFKMERVGINSALVECGAIVRLLIDKGVFTENEWWTAACKAMEAEIRTYEDRLTARLGQPVTLDTPYIDPVSGKPRV